MIETKPAPEVVTPIMPSEALRLGRLVRPLETSGRLFRGEHMACAIGAMAIGYGWDGHIPSASFADREEMTDDDWAREDAVEGQIYEFVQEKSGFDVNDFEEIWAMNDGVGLSHSKERFTSRDERVLEFLSTVEPKYAAGATE